MLGSVLYYLATEPDPVLMAMLPFSLFFLAFSWFLAIGRFWLKAHQKRRTHYAVTSQRTLILNGSRLRSYSHGSLKGLSVHRTKGKDTGAVTFGKRSAVEQCANAGLDFMMWFWRLPPALYDVHEPEKIHALVASLLSWSTTSGVKAST